MFESFHGEPSSRVEEFIEQEHFHGHLAELGTLVSMKFKTPSGSKVELEFCTEGPQSSNNPDWYARGHKMALGKLHKTFYSAWAAIVPKPKNKSDLAQAERAFLDGWFDGTLKRLKINPAKPVSEMSAAEINKALDQLDKQDSKFTSEMIAAGRGNERFSDWSKKDDALAQYGLKLFRQRMDLKAEMERRYGPKVPSRLPRGFGPIKGRNPGPFSEAGKLAGSAWDATTKPLTDFTGTVGKAGGYLDGKLGKALKGHKGKKKNPATADSTTLLCSNEHGTQLYFIGGDQSVDLFAIHMSDPGWLKDSMILGEVKEITYCTRKDFDNFEEVDYYHALGEETGERPQLRYDTLNKRLYLDGGQYRIEKPLVGTSPGIEN